MNRGSVFDGRRIADGLPVGCVTAILTLTFELARSGGLTAGKRALSVGAFEIQEKR